MFRRIAMAMAICLFSYQGYAMDPCNDRSAHCKMMGGQKYCALPHQSYSLCSSGIRLNQKKPVEFRSIVKDATARCKADALRQFKDHQATGLGEANFALAMRECERGGWQRYK